MLLKYVGVGGAILALSATVHTPPAAAQAFNCGDFYRRVMAAYQVAPLSPEYAQLAATYTASCLPGAGAAYSYQPQAAYSYPQTQYSYPQTQYYEPQDYSSYYGYSADPNYEYGTPVSVGFGYDQGFRRERDRDLRGHFSRNRDNSRPGVTHVQGVPAHVQSVPVRVPPANQGTPAPVQSIPAPVQSPTPTKQPQDR